MKNCTPFIKFIGRINNTQADDAHDIDVVMLMCNLIEYSDWYSKTSGILYQHCRDELAVVANGDIFILMQLMLLLTCLTLKQKWQFKQITMAQKNAEIMVPLKHRIIFWKTLLIPLINCENFLYLNRSNKCIIVVTSAANQGATFSTTNTKLIQTD